MVPALKQIYEELGYVASQDEFNADEEYFENFGRWFYFNQREFVGIDTTIGREWDFEETLFDIAG